MIGFQVHLGPLPLVLVMDGYPITSATMFASPSLINSMWVQTVYGALLVMTVYGALLVILSTFMLIVIWAVIYAITIPIISAIYKFMANNIKLAKQGTKVDKDWRKR